MSLIPFAPFSGDDVRFGKGGAVFETSCNAKALAKAGRLSIGPPRQPITVNREAFASFISAFQYFGIAPSFTLRCDPLFLRFQSKESDKAFAFAKWQPSRILKHPTPSAALLPFGRVGVNAIDDINHAHDSAEIKIVSQSDPVFLFDCRQIFRCRKRAIIAGVNEKRAPMICSP